MTEEAVERFKPTGGVVSGTLALLFALVLIGAWLYDRDNMPAPVAAGAFLASILIWSASIRPRVWVQGDTLVFRNMLETVRIPLAAVEELIVRQVLAIRVGGKRYVNPAIGRTRGDLVRPNSSSIGSFLPGAASRSEAKTERVDHADLVEERLRFLIGESRTRLGISRNSEETAALAKQVQREPAWPEILTLVTAVALLVASLML